MAKTADGLESTFGRIAIAQGYATPAQVEDAVEAMHKLAELGFREKLGEVMVKKGFLSPSQVKEILRLQGVRAAHRIEGYEIVSKLGQGGMGAVYKARQKSLDRMVALKILAPHLAKDAQYVERFLREARAVAKLNHPNIIQGIDVGESSKHYYFAMEFVDGQTVADVLRKDGPLDSKRALEIVEDMAQALEHAHKNGLVHRDVKPDNIMLTKNGEAKLCDLGLAKSSSASDPSTTAEGRVVMGTPHYISPEQAKGESSVDIRADIYSLGGTLFHMVAGRTPFVGASPPVVMTKHLTDLVDDPRQLNPELDEPIVLLIGKMMAKATSDRYANPTELLEDVRIVASGQIPPGITDGALGVKRMARHTPLPDIKRHRTRHGGKRVRKPQFMGYLIGLGVLVLLGGAAITFMPRGRKNGSSTNAHKPPPVVRRHSNGNGTHELASDPNRSQPGGDPKMLFEQAIAFSGKSENAQRFDEVIARFRSVQANSNDTEYVALAAREAERWRIRHAKWKTGELDRLRGQTKEFVQKGEFAKALETWDGPAKEYLPDTEAESTRVLEAERKVIIDAGMNKLRQLVDQALAHANDGSANKARRSLAQAASIGLPEVSAKLPSIKKLVEDTIRRQQAASKKRAERDWTALYESIITLAKNGEFSEAHSKAKQAESDTKYEPWRDRANLLEHDMRRMAMRQELALEGLATRAGTEERVTIHKGARGYRAQVVSIEGDSITIRPQASTSDIVVLAPKDMSADDIRMHAPIKLSDPNGKYDFAILLMYTGSHEQAMRYFQLCTKDQQLGAHARKHLEAIGTN